MGGFNSPEVFEHRVQLLDEIIAALVLSSERQRQYRKRQFCTLNPAPCILHPVPRNKMSYFCVKEVIYCH